MPITENGFERLSQEEIYDRLVKSFENQFDKDVQSGDLVIEQFEALAETLYENQEAALEQVYNAAYIQDASGQSLDKLVQRLGLERLEATSATGVLELTRDSRPTSTYTIPSGSEFQTQGSDPIRFETTSVAQLKMIDELNTDLSSYSGDTGDFNIAVIQSSPLAEALELPAITDSMIQYDPEEFGPGTTVSLYVEAGSNSTIGFEFGIEDFRNDYYEALIDIGNDKIKLTKYKNGSVETSNSVTESSYFDSSQFHMDIEYGINGTHTFELVNETRSSVVNSVTLSDNEYDTGGNVGFVSRDNNDVSYVINYTTIKDTANIQSLQSGPETNVSKNTITESISTLSGVDSQTNPLPTGDNDYEDVDGDTFVVGEPRETDDELRQRAFETTIIGGAATSNAVASAIREVSHVDSLTLYKNKTGTDNANGNGLPAHSFEAVVYYTGPDEDIAQAIYDSKSIDSNDVGGNVGTATTYDIESEVLAQTETIHWSTAPEVDIDMKLELVVDDTYIGDEEIRSIIVNYIGGTDVDGDTVSGLSVGEDLYVAVLKDVIVSPEQTGVWDVNVNYIDNTGDTTDDTTTINSARVLDIGTNEVAVTNARDSSIELTTVSK